MAQMNAHRVDTLWLGAMGLLAVIALGILITRRLSQSIQQLTAASEVIARGELDREVPTTGIKELDILSQAFNQMSDQSDTPSKAGGLISMTAPRADDLAGSISVRT
ncbi:MAG: HAMP domain-containing protein [Thermosynechococcaceae cyanobacterium]